MIEKISHLFVCMQMPCHGMCKGHTWRTPCKNQFSLPCGFQRKEFRSSGLSASTLTELSHRASELQTFSSMLNAYLHMRTLCRSVCDSLMEEGSMELDQREAGLGVGKKPVRQSKVQSHRGLIRWDPVSIPRINSHCPVITVYFCYRSPANSIPQQH